MDIFSNQNVSNKLPLHHFLVSLLLWKNYLPSSWDLLLKVLAEVQIIGILITDAYDHFNQDESNSITTLTSDIGNYASFRFNYNTTWSSTFIFVAFGIISAYLFIVLCLTIAILIAYSQKFYQESRLTKIWNGMGIIHYNLIFLIIQQFILSIIKDVTTDEDSSLGSNVNNKTAILCIGIILIIINSLYALFISKFAYFPVKDRHITATRTSNFQFIGVFFKLVDTLFNTFLVENDAKPWIMLVTTFIFFGTRLNRYLKEYPFYHYRALQIFFTMILVQNLQLVLNVIWVLIDLSRNISFVMVIGSHFIFTLFAIQFAWSHIRNNFWKFASRSNKQLKSVNEFYKKSGALDILLRKGGIRHLIPDKTRASEYEILFMQLISSHGETCQEMSCSCRILLQDKTFSLEKSDEKNSHKFDGEKLYFTCICELYNDGIKYLSTNVLLKLQLSHFLIENDETAFLTAINLATSVKSETQNLEFRLTKLELLRQIETRIKGSFLLQNSTLNVKQLIDYYMIKQQLRYSIILNTKMFEEFWETYKSPHPHMIKLTRLSRAINRDADKIQCLWENLSQNYASFCYKDYIVFALYARFVRSAPFTSEKLITKYFAVNSLRLTTHAHGARHGGSFFVEDNIFICFSLDQGSFAHISFVSQNVEDLGYQMKDLTGKSIGLLMPPVFAKKHHNYITNQILSGHTNLMARDLHIFLRCNNGFLQPATAYIMPFPYLEKGFNCLAIIKLTKNLNENYIVMLPDGKIDASSEKLAEQLGLNSKNMDSCYIDEVCPEAYKIFKYINNIPMLEAKVTNGKGSPTGFNSGGPSIGSEQDLWKETQSSHILAGSSFKQKKSLHAVLLQKRLQNQIAAEAERNQDIIEDFEHRGARLKFMTYQQTTKASQKNDKPNFSLDVTVSKIKYAGEDVYILKTVKVEEEVTMKEAVISQEIIDGTISNVDSSGEVSSSLVDDELEDISRVLQRKFTNLVPASKIKHRRDPEQMGDTAGKRYKSTEFGSTKLEETPKVVLVARRNPLKGKVGKEPQGEVNIKENLKQDIKDYIKQNILKEVDPFLEAGDTSSTRSVTKGLLTLSKLEKAIYYKEGITSYKIVKGAVVGFLLMAIALFIYYLVQGNTNFANLKENVNILSLTIKRLFNIVETNRRATIVNLLQSGFVPKERNGYTDFTVALIGDYLFVSGNLSQDNNQLRESVYRFNSKQQAEFYQMLSVYQVDNTSTITEENSFDLCSQLVSAGYRLYAALPDTPTSDNPDLNFIRNNTMNDLVIHSENLFSLLQAEDTTIIQGMKNMQLALLMILIGAGIMAIIVLIKSEFTFIRKKMLFFDFFLRIDDNEVDIVLAKTNAFLELLKDNNNSEEDIMNLMQDAEMSRQANPISAKRDAKKLVKSLKRQNKKGDFSKINKDSWIGVLSLGVFVACFWAVYGFLYIFFIQKEASTTSIKWQIIQTDTLLARLSEAITILYMYIGGNEPSDVTIRGYPLSVEFENNYDIIMSSNEFFAGLEQKDFGNYTDEVRSLLTGDLCPIVESENGFSCYADGEGSKLHGMVGVTNYFLQMVNLLKTAYDDSNKTIEAKRAVYSRDDYGNFERIYFTTLIPSYQQLEEVSREIFLATLDQFQQEILTINIVSLIFFLLLGRYYWTTGLKSMQMEKIYFREMMKVIPVMIILQNKFLHTYLMNNSKKLFNKKH